MTHPLPTLLAVPLAIAITIPATNPFPKAETPHQKPLSAVSATRQIHIGPCTLTPKAFC